MSKITMTPAQHKAVFHEGGNILVSAGAGSGKTAVLTDRVLRKLAEGVSLDQLVIITFTNLAAMEMRQRIKAKLSSIPELENELLKLDQARIMTFDALCLRIVKDHHYLLRVDEQLKIADPIILDRIKKEALEQTFKEAYTKRNPDFEALISRLFDRSDQLAQEAVMTLARGIETLPDKERYLGSFEDNYLSNAKIEEHLSSFNSFLNNFTSQIKTDYETFLEVYLSSSNEIVLTFAREVEICYRQLLSAKDTSAIIKAAKRIEHPRVPRVSNRLDIDLQSGLKEAYLPVKDKVSKLVQIITELMADDEADLKEAFAETKATIMTVVGLTRRYLEILQAKQQELKLYHFSDIMAMAIRVFEEYPEVTREYKSGIQEILVDEYQDTNDLQDRLLELIQNDNLFTVGDIKQAIYGFRDANPRHFLKRYQKIKDEGLGTLIELVDNFRSRSQVLKTINEIFSRLMDKNIGGIDYHDNQSLRYGQKQYEINFDPHATYDPVVLTYEATQSEELGLSKMALEARIVTQDIVSKLSRNIKVYDLKQQKLRQASYRDFAILIDRKTDFGLFQAELVKAGIPTVIYADEPFSEGEEIRFLSLFLSCLQGLLRDELFQAKFKPAFIGLARSFVYQIADDDIVKIVLEGSLETAEDLHNLAGNPHFSLILDHLYALKDLIDKVPVDLFVRTLYEKTNIYLSLSKLVDPGLREARLDYLESLLASIDHLRFEDLVGYLEHVYKTPEADIEFQKHYSETENAVQIMTMHKSKGLEFSICYYPGLGKRFNYQENKNHFIYDRDLGLYTKAFANGFKKTFLHYLASDKNYQEYVSERIRLFYVALTRAREQQILILEDKFLEQKPIVCDRHQVIDLWERKQLAAFAGIFPYLDFALDWRQKGIVEPLTKAKSTAEGKTKEFGKILFSTYSKPLEAYSTRRYAKQEAKHFTKSDVEAINFGDKLHKAFEFFDFHDVRNSLLKVQDDWRLFFTKLLETEPFHNLENAKIHQELPFINVEEDTTRSGVIDLVIEYDDLCHIIDYKLKAVDDPAYLNQLEGYRNYLFQVTGKPIKTYLYSILEQKLIEIGETK